MGRHKSGWGSLGRGHHGRWGSAHRGPRGYGRRGGGGLGIVGVVLALILVGSFSAVAWIEEHASRFLWTVMAVGVLGGSVYLVFRSFSSSDDTTPHPSSTASNATWDVTGMRLAIDAGVAPSLIAALQRVMSEPVTTRLASLSRVLLDARPQWRLTALDATKPLPEPKADKLFESWASDVRKRFAQTGRPSLEDAYRTSGLLVVCLHVQTSQEIPDATSSSADAVARTLEHLQTMRTDIRQVDLWSSSEPLSAGELSELDRTLVFAESPPTSPEDLLRY